MKNYTNIFESLRSKNDLDSLNYTSQVFIVDKQKNQRGRIDDRDEDEIKNDSKLIGLYSYNSVLVSEIKKKMNDDIRILFTEYRQKRKGNFNSNIRRLDDLDRNEKNKNIIWYILIIAFGLIFVPPILNRLKSNDIVRSESRSLKVDNFENNAIPLSFLIINDKKKKVPQFNFRNQNGRLISNKDYLGKVYVIEFFLPHALQFAQL